MENWTSKNSKTQGGASRLLIGFVLGFIVAAILYYLASAWSINQEPVEDRYRRYKEEARKENEMSNNLNGEEVNDIRLYTDNKSLLEGKSLYDSDCVACHKADGGGGIGPNLTDNYWILGGGFDNIYNVITEGGRPGKGMVPWTTYFTPKEIALLTSYIISLNGTTPEDPKSPEGDIIWSKEM